MIGELPSDRRRRETGDTIAESMSRVDLATIIVSFAEQIAVRGRDGRRRRLQEPVVQLVAEKSDIAHLQDWKGFVRNGHERAARQRRLAHAATHQRKGEFILE